MTGQYIRASARKLGITPEEYAARVDAGEKWCSHCRGWHDRGAFGPDASTTNPFRADMIKIDTDGGRAAYVGIGEAFADVRRKAIIDLRGRAAELRKLPAEAKWLGDPKRARLVEIVALPTWDDQRALVCGLPKATKDSLGWSGHRLTRAGQRPSSLIDRIVVGARLWTARKT